MSQYRNSPKALSPMDEFLEMQTVMQPQLVDVLAENDYNKICSYLKNPTSNGIWRLKGIWLEREGITDKILQEVKETEYSKKSNKKIKTPEAMEKSILTTAKRMTFALVLFTYLSLEDSERIKFTNDMHRDDFLLIQTIEKKFSKDYSQEISYFKDNLLFPALYPRILNNQFVYLKDGLILCWNAEPKTDASEREFEFLSLGAEPLKKLAHFFHIIGKIKDFTVYPTYSPEDEVYRAYAFYLQLVLGKIFEEEKIGNSLHQSVESFHSGNYPYCISTIGLAFEEQLTQIYETLFRAKCPQGLTIGELLDLINIKIREKNPSKVKQSKAHNIDISNIYKRINTAIDCSDSTPIGNKDLLILLRDMLTITKENEMEILNKLKMNFATNESYTIFPLKVVDEMDELIKYRNAISHRSRVPVGSFEATKSIYDIVSLSIWWRDEKKLVNWDDNPDTIIKQMVNRNNPSTVNTDNL